MPDSRDVVCVIQRNKEDEVTFQCPVMFMPEDKRLGDTEGSPSELMTLVLSHFETIGVMFSGSKMYTYGSWKGIVNFTNPDLS